MNTSTPETQFDDEFNSIGSVVFPIIAAQDTTGEKRNQYIEIMRERLKALFTSERTKIREMVEGMKKPKHDWSKDEHGKNCVDGCTYCCNAEGTTFGYNTALQDILTALQAGDNQ